MDTKKSEVHESLQPLKCYDAHRDAIVIKIQRSETKCPKESAESRFKYRYIVVLVGFCSCFLLTGYRMNVSVNMVAMVNNSVLLEQTRANLESSSHITMNATKQVVASGDGQEGDFMWSPETQNHILGSYGVGFVITQFPAGILVERFGSKWFLFWASFITMVCTFLIPMVSWLSVPGLVVVQLLRGLAQGFIMPAVYALASNWIPKIERGYLYTIMNSGFALGASLGSLSSGLLCASVGRWLSSFYTFGAAGIVLSSAIAFFIHENPKVHPYISKAEIDFILTNQENKLSRRRPNLPWRKIFTSLPVYALAFAYFGLLWQISQFVIVHSIFLGTILHYPIKENGFFIAVSFLLQFIISQLSGCLSSYMMKKKFASVNHLRKLFNFLSCLGFSAGLFGIYLVGCNRSWGLIFSILSNACVGFGYAGCWIATADMSPTFAASLNGICSTFGSVSTFIVPLVVGYLTDEMQTIEQWNKFFFISIGIVMSSGIIFAIFGSAELQPWNHIEEKTFIEDKLQRRMWTSHSSDVKR